MLSRKMGTTRHCQDQDVGSVYWQCSRRHPVQPMGGVCAVCLREQLSKMVRSGRCCAEARTSSPMVACRYWDLAHPQSDSDHPTKNIDNSVQPCDGVDVQEMSAADTSSEQISIASLIEREVEEGRHRFSDFAAGCVEGSNEALLSLNHHRCAYDKAQLTDERRNSSYTSPHLKSYSLISCKSNVSSLLTSDHYYKLSSSGRRTHCMVSSSSWNRCNDTAPTVGAAADGLSDVAKLKATGDRVLLTKSKSTGSDPLLNCHNIAAHKWSAKGRKRFWHKRFIETSHDTSPRRLPDLSSVAADMDDSALLMKLTSCSNSKEAPPQIKREMMLKQFMGKLLSRSTSSNSASSSFSSNHCNVANSGSPRLSAQESLINMDDHASSTSPISCPAPVSPAIKANGDARVCGHWLPNLMAQIRARCTATDPAKFVKSSSHVLPKMQSTDSVDDCSSRSHIDGATHLQKEEEARENENTSMRSRQKTSVVQDVEAELNGAGMNSTPGASEIHYNILSCNTATSATTRWVGTALTADAGRRAVKHDGGRRPCSTIYLDNADSFGSTNFLSCWPSSASFGSTSSRHDGHAEPTATSSCCSGSGHTAVSCNCITQANPSKLSIAALMSMDANYHSCWSPPAPPIIHEGLPHSNQSCRTAGLIFSARKHHIMLSHRTLIPKLAPSASFN